jgi:hypothetical protein
LPWSRGPGDRLIFTAWNADAHPEIASVPIAADGTFSLSTANTAPAQAGQSPVLSLLGSASYSKTTDCSRTPVASPAALAATNVFLNVRDATGHVLSVAFLSTPFDVMFSDSDGTVKGSYICKKDTNQDEFDYDLQLVAGFNAIYKDGNTFKSGPFPSNVVLGF